MHQTSGLTKKIAFDTGKLFAGSLWRQALGVVVGLVTARVLGPADFGVLKVISFVPSLVKFGSFGFDGVAQREIPHLRGAGVGLTEENQVKSVAFTADLIWAGLLAVIVIVASLFYQQPVVRYGLWISAASLVLAQIGRLYGVICTVDKRFGLMVRAGVIASTTQSLVILTTIYWGRVYSVLTAGLLASLVSIVWYRRQAHLDFHWSLATVELWRQFRIALPLAGSTVAFGLFAWIERIQILSLFGAQQLGVYMLTVTFYELGLQLVNPMFQASTVHLYEWLGRDSDVALSSTNFIRRPSLIWAYLFPLTGGLLWLVGPWLISVGLPQYLDAATLLPWVGVMLTAKSVSAMPRVAMNSKRLNMQTLVMLVALGESGLFAGFTWAGVHSGWGIEGAAMAKAFAFVIAALIIFGLTYPFFFTSLRSLLTYLAQVTWPLLVSVVIIWGLNIVWPGSDWVGTTFKSLLFIILYTPLLYYLERQTRIFETLGKPMLIAITLRARQRLSQL